MPDHYKVVTTAELDELNQAAIKAGYNRALSDEFMDSVPRAKKHIAESLMIREHAAEAGRSALPLPGHRRHRGRPQEAFLDVSFAHYNALETLEVTPVRATEIEYGKSYAVSGHDLQLARVKVVGHAGSCSPA